MKVGIVTFWNATNYGAVLQLFALERVLSAMNVEAETIAYIPIKKVGVKEKVKTFIERMEVLIGFHNRKDSFGKFRYGQLRLSKQVTRVDELKKLSQNYDYIIAGSDQIWNYKLSKMEGFYFCEFAENKKKIAYAASFGVSEIPVEFRSRYVEGLNGFRHISVRETKGSEIVKTLINKDVPTVLDPTLLLNGDEWKDCLSISTYKDNEEYVLVYCLRKSSYLMRLAQKLCNEKGLKLRVLNPKMRHSFNKESLNVADPKKFVEMFYNAKFVLTNSFHGTVFSINFNKTFYVELWPSIEGNANSRMEGILEICGLKDRIINESIPYEYIDKDIDWNDVNNRLNIQREKSFKYLKDSLGVFDTL